MRCSLLVLGLALLIGLSACTRDRPPEAASSLSAQVPSGPPASAVVTPTAAMGAASCPDGASQPTPTATGTVDGRLLWLEWRLVWPLCEALPGLLRATEPSTPRDLTGMPPLPSGYVSGAALSPDGRTVALVDGGVPGPAVLPVRFIDLTTFVETARWDEAWRSGFAVGLPRVAWSRDGTRLYVVVEDHLWTIDPTTDTAGQPASLGFLTEQAPFVHPDGQTLLFLGFELADERNWVIQDPPFVAVVDAAAGGVRARIPLPGVRVGRRQEQTAEGERLAFYAPALALAPDAGRLYVAHADEDLVTVVDLHASRAAPPVPITEKQSTARRLLGRLTGLVVRPAAAKSGPEAWKQLIVSPDGQHLYLTGERDDLHPDRPPAHLALGVKALDAETMQLLHEEPGVNRLALSPDGSRLYSIGYSIEYDRAGNGGYNRRIVGHGLKVLDARTGALLVHLTPQTSYEAMALSTDGRFLALTALSGANPSPAAVLPCADPCSVLRIVDTERAEIGAERSVLRAEIRFALPSGGR